MLELGDYYDYAVNGRNLSTLAALRGALPAFAPAAPQQRDARNLAALPVQTAKPAVALPPLRAQRLAPVPHVIVHGSQATGDACAFSDVDVLVVLDDLRPFTVSQHRDAIRELRELLRAVYRHDPLMHHGLMFFPMSRLGAYDESFLPLETLRLGCAIHGPAQLSIATIPPDASAVRRRLRSAVEVLRERLRERAYERGDYAFKQFLSNVLLLPALTAAARGEFVYKRESFGVAKQWFAANEWSGISRAEELRTQWRVSTEAPVQRWLGEVAHPALRVRSAARNQRRENVARFSARSEIWRDELRRTLDRAEAIAA